MLDAPYLWIATASDWFLGWLLFLPRDLALCGVAALMAAVLVFARKLTTDQEWLHRAAADKRRQKQLLREAHARGDKEAAARHQGVITRIRQMSRRRFAGRDLFVALLPLALLIIWSFARLTYLPPRQLEPVEVRAVVPHNAIGQMAHLAPEPGLDAMDGWVQRVVAQAPTAPSCAWDRLGAWIGSHARAICCSSRTAKPIPPEGVVIWHVIAYDQQPHMLQVRYAGQTCQMPFRAGKRVYEQPLRRFSDAPLQSIEVVLKPRRLLGVIGGVDCLRIPPWLLVCLILILPLVRLLRSIFRIV